MGERTRQRAPRYRNASRARLSLGAHAVLAALGVVSAPAAASAEAPAHALSPEAGMVFAYRLGAASTGYPVDDRFRGGYRAGVSWGMTSAFTLGLFYERVGAGRERYESASYASDTSRSLHEVLLDLRVFPVRKELFRLFLELDVGASMEAVEQSGLRGDPPASYRCRVSSSGALALGAAVGGEVELGYGFALVGRAYGAAHRLGDDPLSDDGGTQCAAGAGTLTFLGATLGLTRRFDLGR